MTSTMSRRSILKYAAAMGAALALPMAGKAAGAGAISAIAETPVSLPERQVRELAPLDLDADERIQRACDRATELFRDDMTTWDGFTQQGCAKLVSAPDWPVTKNELVSDLIECMEDDGLPPMGAQLHAQLLVWGIEARAAGYTPEQCRIEWPMVNGRREMALVHVA